MANNPDSTEQNIGLAHLKNKHNNSERIQQNSLTARLMSGEHAAELVDRYYQQIYLFMQRLGHNRIELLSKMLQKGN